MINSQKLRLVEMIYSNYSSDILLGLELLNNNLEEFTLRQIHDLVVQSLSVLNWDDEDLIKHNYGVLNDLWYKSLGINGPWSVEESKTLYNNLKENDNTTKINLT